MALRFTELVGPASPEAAAVGDCAVGTVRSRVARARATLMDLLEEEEEPAAPAAV